MYFACYIILFSIHTILQTAARFFLICIFVLSITPVIFLHNMFADHLDLKIEHHHKRTNEVAKAGIDCHTENFVAERNFLFMFHPVQFLLSAAFPALFSTYIQDFYSQHHFFAELRGPPVKA